MPGIKPGLIVHELAINPLVKPVNQKRKDIASNRKKVVLEEV